MLFGALRQPFGSTAALLGALALAALPVSVLTARSDTMDCLLSALSIAALWCSWIALRSGRRRWTLLAALLMGVAFNVKLTEALLPLPALALLWWWAAPASARGRAGALSLAALVLVASALSWTVAASLTPAGQRPYPIGSENGSVWALVFLYNGLDRLDGHAAVAHASATPGSAPGPLRLLEGGPSHYLDWLGLALVAALLLGALATVPTLRRRRRSAPLSATARVAVAIGVWLGCGLIVLSAIRRLEARYLEILAPALSATLGISLTRLPRGRRVPAAALGVASLALLVAALSTDIGLIATHRSDSRVADRIGLGMARYLRSHRGAAHYELASAAVFDAVGLVARDGLPVLMLNEVGGPIVSVARLGAQVRAGRVRFYYAAHGCHSRAHCPETAEWAHAHSTPVAGYPGLRRFAAIHEA